MKKIVLLSALLLSGCTITANSRLLCETECENCTNHKLKCEVDRGARAVDDATASEIAEVAKEKGAAAPFPRLPKMAD